MYTYNLSEVSAKKNNYIPGLILGLHPVSERPLFTL